MHVVVLLMIALWIPSAATADPCGMVPPIYLGEGVPIARVGPQKTYVFYEDGVETFVIRPGFTGKVEDFGMLIPFPEPPAVRKVPDDIFSHIAAAVDPPEVIVDLTPQVLDFAAAGAEFEALEEFDLEVVKEDEVRVVRREAVGMYEVAVLEAGSAQALKRWMDNHGYKYPDGMDKVCEEYVDEGWCFVAVKTQVGQKSNVDPQPGQRQVNARRPAGTTFDGHVQGMGFRFRTKEFVVPMRLSAFNEGELRNVVYMLTDEPSRIRDIDAGYVVRQIPGGQLLANITEPLPLRIIGGDLKDISDYRLKTLPQERDPTPHNGQAKELFAADLLATSTGELALGHEEREKVLLRIGEGLGLRGPEIDALNAEALADARQEIVEKALADLKEMTLTVVDGDFPRKVIADDNLHFAAYAMPADKNTADAYDAKVLGAGGERPGVLRRGKLKLSATGVPELHLADGTIDRGQGSLWGAIVLSAIGGLVLLGLFTFHRRQQNCRK